MKREESFEIGEHGELVVVTSASNILLTEGEPGRIDVVLDGKEAALDLFDITQVGDLVSIQMRKDAGRRCISPRVRIAVSLPAGSDVDIKTASGDILGSVDTGSLPPEVQELQEWATAGYPLGDLQQASGECLDWLRLEYLK